jgi:hypothetical protein
MPARSPPQPVDAGRSKPAPVKAGVGACCTVLQPVFRRLEAHVLAAERRHGDDTTVPVLAQGKTDTGRPRAYMRDDRPFAGPSPPAALFYYARDCGGEYPQAHLAHYTRIWSISIQWDSVCGSFVKPQASLPTPW